MELERWEEARPYLPATNFCVLYPMLQVKRKNAFLSLSDKDGLIASNHWNPLEQDTDTGYNDWVLLVSGLFLVDLIQIV